MRSARSNPTGADHGTMRQLNRTLVLDVIKRGGRVSRADIARETSLAKPTVSAIVESLVAEGLVREVGVGLSASGGGRPPMLLEFDARSQSVVGVRVGVRRTVLVVADALGRELHTTSMSTPRGRATAALRRIAREVEQAVHESGTDRSRLAAVGVCMPGLVDMQNGVCLLAPNLGWNDVPVADVLGEAVGAPVFVVNTADAAIVVEGTEGVAQGAHDVVLVYIDRGIGAAALSEGRLLHGSSGLTGEFGHCYVPGATTQCSCGKIGCLETLADGPSIARAAGTALAGGRASSLRGRSQGLSAKDVSQAAAEGDDLAIEVLGAVGRELGQAASWLVNIFNPELLLIGGGVASAGPALLEPLEAAVREYALAHTTAELTISPWTLGRDAGVRGAVLVALQSSERFFRLAFHGGDASSRRFSPSMDARGLPARE